MDTDEANLLRDRIRSAVLAGDAHGLATLLAGIFEAGRVHGERWTELAIGTWLDSAAEIHKDTPEAHKAISGLASDVKKRKWRRPEFRSVVDETERKS